MPEDTLHTWRREQLVAEVRTQRERIAALEAEVRLAGETMREIGEVMSDKNIRITRLEHALAALVDRYIGLVNSGDCGHWNPEEEPEVRGAWAVLKGQGDG